MLRRFVTLVFLLSFAHTCLSDTQVYIGISDKEGVTIISAMIPTIDGKLTAEQVTIKIELDGQPHSVRIQNWKRVTSTFSDAVRATVLQYGVRVVVLPLPQVSLQVEQSAWDFMLHEIAQKYQKNSTGI